MASQYKPLTEQLQKQGYRVVSSDVRGLGQTHGKFKDFTAKAVGQDVTTLIDTLKIPDERGVIVVGNSMAAAAGVWYMIIIVFVLISQGRSRTSKKCKEVGFPWPFCQRSPNEFLFTRTSEHYV